MAEDRDAFIRSYLDEVFSRHELGGLDKYWHENLVSHWLGETTLRGLPAWRAAMADFFHAFPDVTYTPDDVFVSGDKGVWRGTWSGIQTADWQGMPASGRKATWTAIVIGRFQDGKLIEDWAEYDRLGLFRQLGAL